MSARKKHTLWLAIDVLEAQETISLIKATTYTKLKKADREGFDSKLKRRAYPDEIYAQAVTGINVKESILYKLRKQAK
jgi:hypothetical protein